MTPKCSLFVDAGYLLASSASRLTGTSLRSGIHVKHGKLIRGLIKAAEETTGLPVLRVHWYDSAKDGVPDRSQERIGELPKVKLRLGRFGYDGQQKGVDLRLGLDMVAHAHHKAAEVFLLVSGDDDLTEAVEDVQVHGVTVLVLAVPGADGHPHGVSRHLVRAADEIVTLDPNIIDGSIIPIETPDQAKDDGGELHVGDLHHESGELPMGDLRQDGDVLLIKPRVPAEDLALIADAMVFGSRPFADDVHDTVENARHQGESSGSEHSIGELPIIGEALSLPDQFDSDGDVIGLNEVELLLNAAHLDDAGQREQAAPDEATLSEEAHAIADAEHLNERHLTPEDVIELVEVAIAEIDAAHGTESEITEAQTSEPAAAPTVSAESTEVPADNTNPAEPHPSPKPSLLIPKPGPHAAPAKPNDLGGGVVNDTLHRLFRPTPRDVSSVIGRPAERPLRPTYSTGPDHPKQGTWAAQWSEVIEQVVGRVLNSLQKSTTAEAWNVIGLGRPSIPQEIDKALLLDATEAMGVYTLSDAERHEVRAEFWREFDRIHR